MMAFYHSFPSVHDVEAGIMELLLKAPTERMEIIFKSLYSDLDKIVRLYEENSRYYDRMDLSLLWYTPLLYAKRDLENQRSQTQQPNDEYKEASDSYEIEMTPFNGMSKEEISVLERRLERCKNEYQEQKTKLETLYAEYHRLEKESLSIQPDIFRLLCWKCQELLPVVEKYYTKPVEATKEESEIKEPYLPMSLVAPIYELTNGSQFETVSSTDFFHALNLRPDTKPLDIRKKEKVRVCYLINRLSEKILADKRGV